ncbi:MULTISPECIES: CHRD domain-containing protein [Methylomonas]|uniref:CHRD domain-containing protein n=1 Tax=Methylomonas TaxID=416 RepID=UPI0012324046|nr:CHRD domain-containing protein [Methylomonas rhizoryzae]
MKNHFGLLLIGWLAASGSALAANQTVYDFELSGAAEVPSVSTPATGSGSVSFDLDLKTMRIQMTFDNLTGTTTAAHIHCCTLPGSNTGVATITPTFTGFPLGVSSGNYDFTYDLTQTASYSAGFLAANGGTADGAMAALLTGADNGLAYFNLHTSTFGGGEIRGWLQPAAVPLPAAAWLFAGGLIGLLPLRTGKRPT